MSEERRPSKPYKCCVTFPQKDPQRKNGWIEVLGSSTFAIERAVHILFGERPNWSQVVSMEEFESKRMAESFPDGCLEWIDADEVAAIQEQIEEENIFD